jgi:molybdopterin molybdotransferase
VKSPTSLISFEEALAIVMDTVQPVTATEPVRLDFAANRAIAGDFTTSLDVPTFTRSSMDGYAVRSRDTTGSSRENPVILSVAGVVYAGDRPKGKVSKGSCMQVATGAILPTGADAVVKVEDTAAVNGRVQVYHPVEPGENIGRIGEDVRKDAPGFPQGTVVDANKISLLASQGKSQVEVYARPQIAILPSGNELISVGKRLRHAQIHDSNSLGITAVVDANGGEGLTSGVVRDRADVLRGMIAEGLKYDMVVISGGSSVGDRDLVAGVLEGWGKILFHGVRMRPGKPVLFAVVEGKPLFGFPGVPAASLTCAHVLLAPAVRKMAHLPARTGNTVTLPLASDLNVKPGLRQFIPVNIDSGLVMPTSKEAGSITMLARAEGYITVPETVDHLDRGTPVHVTLF